MTRERRFALEDRAAAIVGALVARLPRPAVLALGRAAGRVLGDLDRRHVAIAADNLRRAFPHWDEARVLRTARGVYAHFGCMLFDVLWLAVASRERLLAQVEFVGVEHYEAARAAGRGVVYPTAHIGNWELHGVAHSLLRDPLAVIARPLDNPRLDARLNAFRTRSGNRVLYKQRALVETLRTLRAGGGVAILIDQNTQEQDGIFVDFFGRPACTTTVVAALAVKTGCAVVPGHTELLPGGRYRLTYEPPLDWARGGNRDAEIACLTQRLTSIIEGWIRERPEQWLWMHRRWHTRPREGA